MIENPVVSFFVAGNPASAQHSAAWNWFNRLGGAVIFAFGANLLMSPWL